MAEQEKQPSTPEPSSPNNSETPISENAPSPFSDSFSSDRSTSIDQRDLNSGEDVNPFSAPSSSSYESEELAVSGVFREDLSHSWIFGKWFLVCGVSAAPSFIWGCWVGDIETAQVLGMLAGILTFIVGYTLAESTQFVQRLLKQPFVRLTAKIGYGTRMAISVLFPIGMGMDMFVGLFSVTLTTAVLGEITGTSREGISDGFLGFYITTLVQGTLLNAILFGYMILVYAVTWLANSNRPQNYAA